MSSLEGYSGTSQGYSRNLPSPSTMPERVKKSESRKSTGRVVTTKGTRTAKACDRCRLKKAKCDGGQDCKNCKTSDSICSYRTRRTYDAKTYFSRMRDVTDEAIQRLYRLCKAQQGFPGTPPSEDNGRVSTTAILQYLGLVEPSLDDGALPQPIITKATDTSFDHNCVPRPISELTPPSTPTSLSSSKSRSIRSASGLSVAWPIFDGFRNKCDEPSQKARSQPLSRDMDMSEQANIEFGQSNDSERKASHTPMLLGGDGEILFDTSINLNTHDTTRQYAQHLAHDDFGLMQLPLDLPPATDVPGLNLDDYITYWPGALHTGLS